MKLMRRFWRWLAIQANVESVREQELRYEIDKLGKKIESLQSRIREQSHELTTLKALERQLISENDQERIEWQRERRTLEVTIAVHSQEIELLNEVVERNRMRVEAETAKACGEVAESLKKPKRDR